MKRLAAMLGVAALAFSLGGCVLAIGNTPDDEKKDSAKRLKAVEERLEALEAKCAACDAAKPGHARVITIGQPGGKVAFLPAGEAKNLEVVLRKAALVRMQDGQLKVEVKEEAGDDDGDDDDDDADDDEDDEDDMEEEKPAK